MFLLIQSENTLKRVYKLSLHSIMFLLILILKTSRYMWTYFTFHNVSINTNEEAFAFTDELPLHSIMFLLILFIAFASGYCDITLHSIMFLLIPSDSPIRKPWLHLYIP